MKRFNLYALLMVWTFSVQKANSQTASSSGIFLEDLTWPQAAKQLTTETIVVIPLGAQAKAHGAHLTLSTDFIQSQFFVQQLIKTEPVVVAPQLNYGFYFPFVKFQGSTSLRHSVAQHMVEDICRSLSRFGPRRFYIVNEGMVTNAALRPAASILAAEGILLSFTDLTSPRVDSLVKRIQGQKEGGHADEIETSKVLYMRPETVNMKLAKPSYGIRKGRGFPTPDSTETGHYLPDGIWGDPTLATKEKGERFTKAMLQIMKDDIAELRHSALPKPAKPDLKDYLGIYKTTDDKTVSIIDKNGLIVAFNNLPNEKLNYDGNDYFAGFYYEVWFERNDTGQIKSLRLVDVSGKTTTAKKQG